MLFSTLAQYFDKLENTPSRLEMTELLSRLFKESDRSEIGNICYLLQGRVLPLFEPVEFGMADKMMIKAIARAYNLSEGEVKKIFQKEGDLGNVAQQIVLKGKGIKVLKGKNINEVYQTLLDLATTTGEGSVEKKVYILSDLLQNLDPLSVRYVIRIPLAKLRLGFSDMTVLDALSWMVSGNKKDRPKIEAAYNVRPDLGFIAVRIKEEGLNGMERVKPLAGVPILMARAERLGSSVEIIEKIGKCAVEYKYDGFRLQVHYKKQGVLALAREKEVEKELQVRLFSRNLEDVTSMYPDIVQGVLDQVKTDEVIFEGEAIAFNPDSGEFLPFQETVQRKRKYDITQKAKDIPLKLIAFDVLFENGKDLLGKTYEERRKILEKLIPHNKNNTILRAEVQILDDSKKMEPLFEDAISQGLEGIMAKKLAGVYQAGARGWNWIKYKRSYSAKLEDTVDAVIMGYDYGQGKRQTFGIGDFLIGIYDNKNDRFVTVAKIGTGLTDEEWRELKTQSTKLKAQNKPNRYEVNKGMFCDVWMEPKLIVEINADEITRSPVHTAGLALRFPRLKQFRKKQPEDTTSLKEIEDMYRRQEKK